MSRDEQRGRGRGRGRGEGSNPIRIPGVRAPLSAPQTGVRRPPAPVAAWPRPGPSAPAAAPRPSVWGQPRTPAPTTSAAPVQSAWGRPQSVNSSVASQSSSRDNGASQASARGAEAGPSWRSSSVSSATEPSRPSSRSSTASSIAGLDDIPLIPAVMPALKPRPGLTGQLLYAGDGSTKPVSSSVPAGDHIKQAKIKKANAEHMNTRPDHLDSKKGTSGQEVMLSANYFRLNHQTNWCLYQYRVDFLPEEDRTFVRKALLRQHKPTLGGYLFDGTILYSAQRLNPDVIELTSARANDGSQVVIRLKMVGHLCMGDYQYLQFFNILIRRCFEGLKLQLVGRNYFDAMAKVAIPQHHLQLWPGYVTSIRQHESGVLMCTEITHKVMRLDTAYHILQKCRDSNRNFRAEYERCMLGAVVLTDYNNKTYKIDGVDWNMKPTGTFKKKTGEEVSFIQYYKQKYNVDIRDGNQPMLIHRSKEKDIRSGCPAIQALVPELCRTTGLTDDMRSNFQLMRAMSEHTRVNPDLRVQKLVDFNKRLRKTQETIGELTNWQMDLDASLVTFRGRVLPMEKILLGQKKIDAGSDVDWTRELRCNTMLTTMQIRRWYVTGLTKFRNEAIEFAKILQKAAASMRFSISVPQFYDVPDDKSSTYSEFLEKLLSSGPTPDMILCIVPNNRIERYSAIKKKTCVDRTVPTQVILAKNLTAKGVMSIATKVAIQMNCKIGGAPWSVEIPVTSIMVVGFDVCHDSSNKSLSYGALVASIDKNLSKYYSAVSHHGRGEELANDLMVNVTKALRKYRTFNNGQLPQRIVFFRDGVGDGQIPYVHNQEVALVNKLLHQMYSEEKLPVKMAYIIVSKRINTRIFTQKNQNPSPGTVVDDVITLPERYDFFLVSQTVRQGTVSPTSYNVIYDTAGLDPDKIQRLAYKLTHMYYNWSGTCRVPAPCQYAHKLAYLVGQSLHRSPNIAFDDSLYFL